MFRIPLASLALAALALAACTAGSTSDASTPTAAETTASIPGSTSTTSTTSTSTSTSTSTLCVDPTAPATVTYAVRPGADPDQTSLDVHVPSTPACDAPVVIWVHGGGYRGGDKRNQMPDKVRLFGDAGWILVSTNYRLTPDGRAGSAEFTDPFDDVAAAVAWVRDHIDRYGGDPSRIALLGHSAGADIVANLATEPAHFARVGLELSDLRCAGPLDTVGFADVPVRAGIGIPPTIGVVRGTPERQRIEADFLARLQSIGVDTVGIDARTLTHEQVNGNIGTAGDTVMTEPLMAFLDECFAAR